MVNMSLDIANNLLTFISSIVALVGVLISGIYGYAHLRGRVATLEDRAERSEREHKEFKVAMEAETRRVEGKIDAMQTSVNAVLTALSALTTEVRVRFEAKPSGRTAR